VTPTLAPQVQSLFDLSGRTALVTGGSRNIGASIAVAFADAGADLVLTARGKEQLEETAASIRERCGRRVETFVSDVTDAGAITRLLEYLGDTGLRPDILVNNAYSVGTDDPANLLQTPDEVWELAWTANVMGPLRLSRAVARGMLDRGSGSIINVLSGSGFHPTPKLAAYGATKAALWLMTRALAVECAPAVRVNALCPGLVTEDGEPRSAAQAHLLPAVPMRRIGRPEEIAGGALYLASDAASYTTGHVIFANGGRPG
jgi:NAD(P)-dependent dehydrogenase (short-subunit alcohol dehydrogenase family)